MSPLPATLQSPPQTLITDGTAVTSSSSQITTTTSAAMTVRSEMGLSSVFATTATTTTATTTSIITSIIDAITTATTPVTTSTTTTTTTTTSPATTTTSTTTISTTTTTSSNNSSSSDQNNDNTILTNNDNNTTTTIKDKDNIENKNDNNKVVSVRISDCDTLVTTITSSRIENCAIPIDSETLNSSVNNKSDVESSSKESIYDCNKKSISINKIDTDINNSGSKDVIDNNSESCSNKYNNRNSSKTNNNGKCGDFAKPNRSDKKSVLISDKNKKMSLSIEEEKNNENEVLDKPRRILLENVNAHITCNLCKGYLIDATTIVECLHSFCHSCIMKHLRTEQYCPRCEMMINTAKPNIKSDTTLQAIVYKLVPGLYEKELMRKRAFYRDRPDEAKLASPEQRGDDTEYLIFGPTENMSLSLEYADIEKLPDGDCEELKRPKYLQCPAIFTVAHLKKFILLKFGINPNLFSVEIMYKVKTIVLSNHYTLMDVAYIYTWKRDAPMRFFFLITEVNDFEEKLKACRQLMKAKEMKNENQATQQKSSLTEENNNNNCTKSGDVSENDKNENVGKIETSIKSEEEISEQETIINHDKVGGTELEASEIITRHDDNVSEQKSNEDNNNSVGNISLSKTSTTLITNFKMETETECNKNSELVEKMIKTEIEVKEEPNETTNVEQNLDKTIENKVSSDGSTKESVQVKVCEDNQTSKENSNYDKDAGATTSKPEKLNLTLSVKSKQSKVTTSIEETKPESTSKVSNKNKKNVKQQQHSGAGQINKSPEQEERKVENIKLKIDLSKQNSVTIINMSGPECSRKEIVKPVKQDKECKQKTKKDKESSPKSSPKGEDRYKVKANEIQRNSPEDNKKLLVPPITIKAERISPNSKEGSTVQLKVKQDELESQHNNNTGKTDKEEEDREDDEEKKSKFLNSFALTPIKSANSPDKTVEKKVLSVSTPNVPKVPLWPGYNTITLNKTAQVSKRKSKEPIKTFTKKSRIELANEQKATKSNDKTVKECQTISFKLAPYPIDSSASTELSKKQEDEKLMPAPPPLKMIDVFKKNGIKQTKSRSSKWTAANKTKLTSLTNQIAVPPGSLTPRPIIPVGIASSKLPMTAVPPGNRTPIARRYPPILPKSPRPNPFANLSTDVNKILQNNGTEIKQISSGSNQEIKVYGPAMVTKNPPKPINSAITAPNISPVRGTIKSSNTNYLNYALMNASKTKVDMMSLGCRTPIYTPSSPIYSPNSPQYMPNYNIPTQPTYKYTKSNASNYLQNVLGQNKQLSNLFPAPPVKKPPDGITIVNNKTSPPQVSITTDRANDENFSKRPYPFSKSPPDALDKSPEPPEKQAKVQSLLNSCNINIPSSLSITITNEDNESGTTSGSNSKHKSPVNNYIEILKLPDNHLITNEQPTLDQKSKTSNQNEMKSDINTINSSSTVSTTPSMKTVTANSTPRSSPIQITGSQSVKTIPSTCSARSLAAVNPMEKKSDIKPPSPNSKDKKSSPEKKITEKNQKKAAQNGQNKKKSPDNTGKSAKAPSDNGNITTSLKKFRHILPRITTTSQNTTTTTLSVSTPTTASPIQKTSPKQLQQKLSPNATSKKQSPNSTKISVETDDKKLEILDLTGSSSKTPPPSVPSLPTSITPNSKPVIQGSSPQMPPGASDIAAFLNETILRAQQHSANGNGIFLPHLAAAASFNPSFASINFGYNIQQAYLMEQFSRMQKAGHDALEKYMQKLKTGDLNTGNKSGRNSPCNSPNTTANTATVTANSPAVMSPAKNNDSK